MHGLALYDVLILLAAAVVTAAGFHRLSINPMLGYFVAGFVIGPHGFALVGESQRVQGLAAFGVVFLLFAIGLELPLKRLWVMRRWLAGLGLLQVASTSALFALGALLLGYTPVAAIVIGGALALSSTAVGLQLLVDRGELATRHGRAAFSMLLVQDLAVVPLLVLMPGLGAPEAHVLEALGFAALAALAVLAGIGLVGHFALRPLLHAVAATRNTDLFAAAALLLVLGAAVATAEVGLSMALGAFLAGMMLAETEFRHQVEADIRPFRGLLLGLFFMTVGMGIDARTIAAEIPAAGILLGALLVGKSAIVAGLGRAFGLGGAESARAGLLLGHAGEFAIVVTTAANGAGVLGAEDAQILIATAALSMALCPPMDALGRALARRARPDDRATLAALAEEIGPMTGHVIVAGYGRVGQIVGRVLSERKQPWIALDMDARNVSRARNQGLPVHFGDATRGAVWKAAGAERASAAAITLDRAEHVEHALRALRHAWPRLPIVTRARDAAHASQLTAAGARSAVPEAMEASLALGAHVLGTLGTPAAATHALIESLRREWGMERGPLV